MIAYPSGNAFRRAGIGLAVIAAVIAPAAFGQATSAPADSEVIRLNPFEIVEQQDDSFTTNSVGSGSRLKLDLRDVPAAYSVINRSFMDAVGIDDLQEAASWAPGQTFFYNTNGGMAIFGEQGSYVSRGYTTAAGGANVNFSSGNGSMRNFYSNSTQSTDSYMVETFDFGRGPNSSLFGTAQAPTGAVAAGAGLSGVNSSQTKRARFDAISTTLQVEFGSWGYQRQQIDYNRPINDRIGIRLNVVNSETPGYLDHDLKTTRGIHLTSTWKIGENTTLRIEGSNDKTTNHGVGINISENFSGWDGVTVFRGPIEGTMYSTNGTPGATSVPNASYGTLQILGGGALTYNGEPSGVDRINNTNYYYDPALGTIMNWQNFATARRADETSRTPVWSKAAPNGAYYVRTAGGTSSNNQPVAFNTTSGGGFGGGSPTWAVLNGLPSDMFANVINNSKFTIPGRNQTWETDWPQNTQRARDLQFALTHQFNENLFFEIGGDMNRIHSENRKNRNQNQPQLDLNMLLPDGRPNPNFLQTFTAGAMTNEAQWVAEQTIRGNVAYTLDKGRWGKYTFNLNLNAQTRNYHGNSWGIAMALPGTDSRRWTQVASVQFLNYYNGDRAYHDPLEVGDVAFTNVTWGSGNTNPTIQPTVMLKPQLVLRGGQDEAITNYLNQYALIQSNASWLDNRIVLLGSVRRDYAKTYRISGVPRGELPLNWDGYSEVYKPIWTGIAANTYQSAVGGTGFDYYNFTYQPLNSAGTAVGQKQLAVNRPNIPDPLGTGLQIPNPLYTGVRPDGYTGVVGPYQAFRSDFSTPVSRTYANTYSLGVTVRPTSWISPFVNYSNQTIPPTFAEIDLEGREKEIVTAKGVDFGARLDFQRFNFKYNYFINQRENEAANNGVLNNVNTLIGSRHWSDTTQGSTNSRGILPLPSNPDYQESKNQGYEIEFSGQLVPGLRVTLNGSVSSRITDLTKRYPLTKTYALNAFNQQMFRDLLEDAGGSIDTTQKPMNNGKPIDYAPGLAVASPIAGAMAGLDQDRAVNAYNNIWIQYDQIINSNTASRSPSSKSINFYADYSIQRGKMRGLRVGGGIQWQGRRQVGNRGGDTILDPTNSAKSIDDPTVDSNTLVWDKGAYNTQMNISYPYRMPNGNTLNLSLRINNPINDQSKLYTWGSRQPNGDLSKPNRTLVQTGLARLQEPINFRLTATYTFGGGNRASR